MDDCSITVKVHSDCSELIADLERVEEIVKRLQGYGVFTRKFRKAIKKIVKDIEIERK